MSSMRNAIQRRNHKERAQPLERKRLGLLEKRKDYTLRAKDHNKKKATTKRLKQLAADRNEDEFYFGMLSRGKGPGSKLARGKRWTGTVDGDRGNRALDVDTVRLLKTQDMGYLRTVRNHAAKELRELEERAVIASAFSGEADDYDDNNNDDDDQDAAPKKRKLAKITFVDQEEMLNQESDKREADADMQDVAGSDAFEDFDESDENGVPSERDVRAAKAARLRRKVQNARKRLKALTSAENELDLQRARMAKTPTIGGVTRRGNKFKVRERKR